MEISSHGSTDPGKMRSSNEDAFFIDESHQVYAVADGLGGLPGGAEASRRIVELLEQTMARVDSKDERVDLAQLVEGINKIVSKEGITAHPFTGMGSTLTLAQIVGDQLLIGHVGDSAAYLFRHGKIQKLTIDHTMETEYISTLGESARATMPREYPHTLTRCVGQIESLKVDEHRITLELGDQILICSDGLSKVLDESILKDTIYEATSLETGCETLTNLANEQGGPDNITTVLIKVISV